jgi:hypothetical protein
MQRKRLKSAFYSALKPQQPQQQLQLQLTPKKQTEPDLAVMVLVTAMDWALKRWKYPSSHERIMIRVVWATYYIRSVSYS